MSTLTLKPAFSTHNPSGARRDRREQDVREKMRPRHGRTMAITAGAIGVGLFSILAPMAWDPTARLSALDETSTDVDIAAERPFEMHPTLTGAKLGFTIHFLAIRAPHARRASWVRTLRLRGPRFHRLRERALGACLARP